MANRTETGSDSLPEKKNIVEERKMAIPCQPREWEQWKGGGMATQTEKFYSFPSYHH